MNRRRKIYRSFNARNKSKEKLITITISMLVVGAICGYGYIKLKEIEIVDKVMNSKLVTYITSKVAEVDKSNSGFITADDISKELDEIKNTEETNTKNEESTKQDEVKVESIKLANTEGWNFYTIQVASVQDDKDLEKFKNELKSSKIPCSVIEVDNVKKVQTYSFFDEEATRSYLEDVKKVYPDAFISQVKIPMLSLEYTSKYEYVGNISNQLNKLITNFKEESTFWKKSIDSINKEEYNTILTNRSKIITDIEKEVDKIDYEGMKGFKDNLGSYVNDINDKITQSSKAIKEEEYHVAMSNFVSCMQGYYSFINTIQGI